MFSCMFYCDDTLLSKEIFTQNVSLFAVTYYTFEYLSSWSFYCLNGVCCAALVACLRSHLVSAFNNRNQQFTALFVKLGYRCHNICKSFSKFYCLVFKFNVGLCFINAYNPNFMLTYTE